MLYLCHEEDQIVLIHSYRPIVNILLLLSWTEFGRCAAYFYTVDVSIITCTHWCVITSDLMHFISQLTRYKLRMISLFCSV